MCAVTIMCNLMHAVHVSSILPLCYTYKMSICILNSWAPSLWFPAQYTTGFNNYSSHAKVI